MTVRSDDAGPAPAADSDDATAAPQRGGDRDQLLVGMLGCGTVGTGVARLLLTHGDRIAGRAGASIRLGPVAVRNTARRREVEIDELTSDPHAVTTDPDVDIVVEVMGGIEPARSLIVEALEAGKSVVTANKELISTLGEELLRLAHGKGARLEYEAAVAGGIPIIKPLRESLAGDRVRRVLGILNGTTNYILTQMTEHGMAFDEALAAAQHLGYAEADPTADVEGNDAAAKTAILASLAFDTRIVAGDVYREGITRVTASDIAFARRMGYVIKLLGIAEDDGNRIGARVHPCLIPADHPLASVRDSFNAVFVEAEAVDDLMFYGRGAGALPTASAVIGDVVSAARGLLSGEQPAAQITARPMAIRPFDELIAQYSIRLSVSDRPGVLAEIAAVFGTHEVSIKSVWQEGTGETAQLVFITHAARERDVQRTVEQLRSLASVRDITSVLRVEGGEV
ncbi:MAG: homoserine dehydrogenase [Actinobacteria bacterium]|nr:homoserine dehydrogenase [Actinomycetota bacterium]